MLYSDSTPEGTSVPEGSDTASGEPARAVLSPRAVSYLRERAVDVELAVREGIRSGDKDIRADDDNYHLGRNYKKFPGLGRIYAEHIAVPYPPCLDGIPRIRLRMHETRVVLKPSEEEGGNLLSAAKEVTYPRWLAQKDVPVVPYLPSYIDHTWIPGTSAPLSEDTSVPLFIVEAPIKALALASHRFPAIAVAGVEAGFLDTAQSLKKNGVLVLQSELGRIAWNGRKVFICYDAGIWNNAAVARGAARLATVLQAEGADPWLVLLPLFRFVDGRKEATEIGLCDDARVGEMIDDAFSRSSDVESYIGHTKQSGDQGPDDFLARWRRYAVALGRQDDRAFATAAFQKLIDAAVPANPARWAELVRNEHGNKAARTMALTTLLDKLPFQAFIAVGGRAAVEAVAASGIGKKTVEQAVGKYEARVTAQVRSDQPSWMTSLVRGPEGNLLPVAENVLAILNHDDRWNGVLAYDQFAEATVFRKPPPWDAEYRSASNFVPGQQVIESDATRLIAWMGKHHGIRMNAVAANGIIDVAAERNGFHPVREYLASLTWDNMSRLDNWLTLYLGVADTPYSRRVGRIFLLSLVARVEQPGCHVRTVPILEGDQLGGKSTACSILGGPWYSDSLSEIGSKDSYQDLRGVWLLELGELAGLSRAEVNAIKHFISKRQDNYRPSYGRRAVKVPRQTVLVGTVNQTEYLRDPTGNTRFLPVRCGRIDLDGLARDREQLLAEALVAHKSGERWWVDRDDAILSDFQAEQDARREVHPWEETIRAWVAGRPSVSTAEVLVGALGIDAAKTRGADGKLVSGVLVHVLGWTNGRDASGCSRYFAPAASVAARDGGGELLNVVEAAARVIREAGFEVDITNGDTGSDLLVRRPVDEDMASLLDDV